MFNKLEARVLSEYKRSRAAPSTFCTLIKHYFSFIKHYIKALAILRCSYGSDMMLLGVVFGKCEMPSTNILQENDHAIIMVKRQFVAYNFR